VSKPDLRSSEEAKAYVAKVRSILRYLGTCDGDMEKGNLRADVNVSVRKPGAPFGTRCEIKNMNSIAFIGEAIVVEARRQIDVIEEGGTIDQETRLYDPHRKETRPMRTKEEAHDYRYFPDPDLLPLELTQAEVDALKEKLPELPDAKKARFVSDLGMNEYNASVLVADKDAADFFEETLKRLEDKSKQLGRVRVAGEVSKWVQGEIFGLMNRDGIEIAASRVKPPEMAVLLWLMFDNEINTTIAKDILKIVWSEGGDPREIMNVRGMKQVTDLGAIEAIIDEIIAKNPDKVAQAKEKPQLVGWFVGQAMKASGGKANPQAVNELLKTKLGI
jgi:aspartyl-tRNA(Asn)/glutamyl-tRNA(Gln) amidotransferase subunit B